HGDTHSFPTRRSSDLRISSSPTAPCAPFWIWDNSPVSSAPSVEAISPASPIGWGLGWRSKGECLGGFVVTGDDLGGQVGDLPGEDRKSTRLNSSHVAI